MTRIKQRETSAPAIAVEVISRDREVGPALHRMAVASAQTRFRRFTHGIERVVIWLRDLNGPKGGVDKHVTVAVHTRGGGGARHISGRAESYEAAVVAVMQRAKQVVLRSPELGARRPRQASIRRAPS